MGPLLAISPRIMRIRYSGRMETASSLASGIASSLVGSSVSSKSSNSIAVSKARSFIIFGGRLGSGRGAGLAGS